MQDPKRFERTTERKKSTVFSKVVRISTTCPSTTGYLNKTYRSEASRFEVSVLQMAPSDTDSTSSWVTFGKKIPRPEIAFPCQVFILYTVIVVSIYNLTVESENSTLWMVLLRSCLGYVLPNPTIKSKHVLSDISQ